MLANHNKNPDSLIIHTLDQYDLGKLTANPRQLSGGFTNQVYHVTTEKGEYVIKIVNQSSPRARSLKDYQEIERLQKYFAHTSQLPAVLCKTIRGEAIYSVDNAYVMVYDYIPATPIAGPIGPVTPDQARKAGELLGAIHANQPGDAEFSHAFEYDYDIDLEKFTMQIAAYPQLQNLLTMAVQTQAAYHRLQKHKVYGHGDYQPHNLLGNGDGFFIIDWELAGLINPGMELMVALITFSGVAAGHFNGEALNAFLDGYHAAGCKLEDNVADAIDAAIHKCWINWIAFNMEIKNDANVMNAFESLQRMWVERENLQHYVEACLLDNAKQASPFPL